MSKDSAERKSEDQSKKGKGILMYHRKKPRKDVHNNNNNAAAAAFPSKQHAPPPPAEETATGWADANSGHLLTCACRVCTGAAPTPLFRSNIIASPQQLLDDRPPHNLPVPVFQFGSSKPPRPAGFRTKAAKSKVFPSVIILPSSTETQKTRREISLPKMEDISFIELLASGDDLAPPQPAISFMDMLQNDKLKGKKVADCNLPCFMGSKLQSGLPAAAGEAKSRNYFMKMVMEEEGADDEELLREVKQELMIREVDAYACLLRTENLDFGKLMIDKNKMK